MFQKYMGLHFCKLCDKLYLRDCRFVQFFFFYYNMFLSRCVFFVNRYSVYHNGNTVREQFCLKNSIQLDCSVVWLILLMQVVDRNFQTLLANRTSQNKFCLLTVAWVIFSKLHVASVITFKWTCECTLSFCNCCCKGFEIGFFFC